ncbi:MULTISPECIES: hypothetical protein [Nocardia]|uniref:hypothetical protein n=1 Tax=Nocardia TaxID=1817 RepID=UPI0024540823|nr:MULTISPECIES: hypothetical protein [Nocardia]
MGQHYKAILLADDTGDITNYFWAWDYDDFAKLTEHSWLGNEFVEAVEAQLRQPSRVVWAGEYADPEPDGETLFVKARTAPKAPKTGPRPVGRYVINHDKRAYVDKNAVKPNGEGWRLHPLSILTAEGNDRGSGDLRPENTTGTFDLVGSWARNHISIEDTPPDGYNEITFDLIENWS